MNKDYSICKTVKEAFEGPVAEKLHSAYDALRRIREYEPFRSLKKTLKENYREDGFIKTMAGLGLGTTIMVFSIPVGMILQHMRRPEKSMK